MILTKEAGTYISLDEPKAFELLHPRSVDEALALYTEERDSAYLAGGCDLLDQLKHQWNNPRRVINLKAIGALRGQADVNGGLRLGALTTLADLERNPVIRQRYSALSLAASRVATPQIRNAGTLGGNLLQDGRHMHRLHDGRIITAIELPADAGRRSHFIKYTMRNVWDFARASIAVAWRPGARPTAWRVVLGGVAATPWRLPQVERLLEGASLDDNTVRAAAAAAIEGAQPLSHNAYKVALVQKLVEQALRESTS